MRFLGDGSIELHAALEQVQNRTHEGLRLAVRRLRLEDDASPHHQVWRRTNKLHDLHTAASLYQGGVRAIRHLQQPPHCHFHADQQEIIRTGIIQVRVMLSEADHGLLFVLRFLHRQQRSLAPDKDRRDHAWEHDQVAQRQDGGFDHAFFIRLAIRNTIQLLCALREG